MPTSRATPPIEFGNLFAGLPGEARANEIFEALAETADLSIERIVSTGQSSPEGTWYDQEQDEWVVLLRGAAGLLIEGEAETRFLEPGDWLHLPAHCRHRVTWTSVEDPAVWLAVRFRPHRSHGTQGLSG